MRELRSMPTYRTTPIIAATAYALPGDRDRFLEMGFSAYLSKPFTADELLEACNVDRWTAKYAEEATGTPLSQDVA
jgi:CheY-like chemotaxis protein